MLEKVWSPAFLRKACFCQQAANWSPFTIIQTLVAANCRTSHRCDAKGKEKGRPLVSIASSPLVGRLAQIHLGDLNPTKGILKVICVDYGAKEQRLLALSALRYYHWTALPLS